MSVTLLLTFCAVALLMGGMAVGVIFRGVPLRGSCGGIGGCACEDAGKKVCEKRKAELKESGKRALSGPPRDDEELVGLRGLP